MSSKHDPEQILKPATTGLSQVKMSGREMQLAARQQIVDEGQAICDKYNADPKNPGRMSHGWGWKGYSFRLDLPLPSHAVMPTLEEIKASEHKPRLPGATFLNDDQEKLTN